MKKKSYEINMTEGSVFKNLMLFALPMIAGNLLQLLYNTADLVVVSRWTGSSAMASVGATGAITGLIINVCIGLSVGASIIISRNFGADNREGLSRSVHTAMYLSAVVGVMAMIVGLFATKPLLVLMGTPAGEILDGAVIYMSIYFIAVPGTMVYNFGASILRAVGDTRRPLYILSVTGLVNVALNLVFVIVFKMGVAGVAIATGIANCLSAVAAVYFLMKSDGVYKLEIKKLKIHRAEFREILRLGIPAGLQSSMYSVSNSVIQSAINSFGAAAMAGNAASGSILGYVYTCMNSFQHAVVTAVSQNFGAKKEKRITQSIGISLLCVMTLSLVLGTMVVIFSKQLLSIYITDSPDALKCGMTFLFYNGVLYFLCGVMEVWAGALRGLGFSTLTAVSTLVGVCGFRLAWILIYLPLNRTLETLVLCGPVSWGFISLIHFGCYLAFKKSAMQRMHQI